MFKGSFPSIKISKKFSELVSRTLWLGCIQGSAENQLDCNLPYSETCGQKCVQKMSNAQLEAKKKETFVVININNGMCMWSEEISLTSQLAIEVVVVGISNTLRTYVAIQGQILQ